MKQKSQLHLLDVLPLIDTKFPFHLTQSKEMKNKATHEIDSQFELRFIVFLVL